jgi:hypothetical protein
MVQQLLANGTVASYAGTFAKDKLTGAAFQSYAFTPAAVLFDR